MTFLLLQFCRLALWSTVFAALGPRISHSIPSKPIEVSLTTCCCQAYPDICGGCDMNDKGEMAGIAVVFISEMATKCFPKYGTMIKPGQMHLAAPFGSVCHVIDR